PPRHGEGDHPQGGGGAPALIRTPAITPPRKSSLSAKPMGRGTAPDLPRGGGGALPRSPLRQPPSAPATSPSLRDREDFANPKPRSSLPRSARPCDSAPSIDRGTAPAAAAARPARRYPAARPRPHCRA